MTKFLVMLCVVLYCVLGYAISTGFQEIGHVVQSINVPTLVR